MFRLLTLGMALFGLEWLINRLVTDPIWHLSLMTGKDLLLLLLCARLWLPNAQRPPGSDANARPLPWLLLALLLATLALLLPPWLARQQALPLQQAARQQAQVIQDWLEAQWAAGRQLSQDAALLRQLQEPTRPLAHRWHERLTNLTRVNDLQGAWLLDPRGRPLAQQAAPTPGPLPNPAWLTRQPLAPLIAPPDGQTPCLDLLLPLISDTATLKGWLVLRLDPQRRLLAQLNPPQAPWRTDLLRLQADGVAPLTATDDWLAPDAAQLLLQAVQHNQLAQTRLPWLAWQPLAVPSWLLVVHTDPQSLTYGLWRWLGLLLAGLMLLSLLANGLWPPARRAGRFGLAAPRDPDSEPLLAHFFDMPFVGLGIGTPQRQHWDRYNQKLCDMLGYDGPSLAKLSWGQVSHPEDWAREAPWLRQVLEEGLDSYRLEKRLLHKDGHLIHTSFEVRPIRDETGRVTHLMTMVDDISQRRQTEQALLRQKALYNTLSHTSQIIVRTTRRQDLFDQVCRILVEQGGLRFAWIGLFGAQTQGVDIVAHHGMGHSFLDDQPCQQCWQGPLQRVRQSGHHYLCNNYLQDPLTQPCHERALLAQFRAAALLPLFEDRQLMGVISLYADQEGFFTHEMMQTLDEMANDVSFALDNLLREAERMEAISALHSANRVVEASQVVLLSRRAEPQLPISYISGNVQRWGFSPQQLLSHSLDFEHLIHPEDRLRVRAQLAQILRTLPSHFRLEYRILTRDQAVRWVEDQGRLQQDNLSRPLAYESVLGDITERKHTELALQESERLFHTLATMAPVGIFRSNARGRLTYLNDRAGSLIGLPPQQVLDNHYWSAVHRDDKLRVLRHWRRAIHHAVPAHQDFRFVQPDGRVLWVSVATEPEFDEHHQLQGFIGTLTNITALKENELRLSQANVVFDNSHEGIMITDAQGRILAVNPALIEHLGFPATELLGRTPTLFGVQGQGPQFFELVDQARVNQNHWRGEVWSRRKDGELRPQLLSITLIRDEQQQVIQSVCVYTDISQLKASEAKLEFLAHHDPLTGLPNRILMQDRLELALRRARREQERFALLMLDLDRFKNVNDSYGHPMGDALLKEIAQRLRGRLRQSDVISRQGGDEFTVLLESNPSLNEVSRIAEQLIELLQQPVRLPNDQEVVVGASIGISLFPEFGQHADELLRQADSALYRAKAEGKGCFCFFSTELTQVAQERLALEMRLRRAIDQEEFCLYYQPQLEISSHRLVGVEALIRWQDPQGELISPAQFIPLAEETGLINRIGEWVLREACRQGQRWREAGLPPLTLAVNLSARQLRQPGLGDSIRQILAETGFPPQFLELELTESALIERESECIQLLTELQALGIQLAIDDFGTGYSSLAYLKRLPLNMLKIDKQFVDDLPHQRDDTEIASAIVAMGHALGLRVLAEGVETPEQLAFLRQLGCDRLQGYLLSPPLPPCAFEEKMRSWVLTPETELLLRE
ncbi:EAL domain-containing protein [Pseudaeromonas sp. ZJS20]|uniref:EAL domain-containing protein n=1 Tax=Pseudaeromonas aegiceratis TaxID=3153928 RepID=UPI00390C5F81